MAAGPDAVGRRVRGERLRQNVGLRELARRVGVSASLISQVELGKASPSVATLYAIVNELQLSLDELLFDPEAARPTRPGSAESAANDGQSRAVEPARPTSPPDLSPTAINPVVRLGRGKTIQLASGVSWERLTPQSPQDVDFLHVTYEVGGSSSNADCLMRHPGSEYGRVLRGRLGVTIGFDTYELGPGDSISFESTTPHRLFNVGDEPAQAIWFVVGRRGDPRTARTSENAAS